MSGLRIALWLLIAWPLPALIAGGLGWKGIWGSGSALTEFLIPIPVAGGVLHVPSFLLTTALVILLPGASPAAASRMRALLFGLLFAGVLWLLNLHNILLALMDGQSLPHRLWDANPIGLFVASDALLALWFTMAAPQRPWLRLEWWTLALIAMPMVLPVRMSLPASSADRPFEAGFSRYGKTRGDEELMVFTRLNPNAPDFRKRAEAWTDAPASMAHPRFNTNAEDMALRFTRNREASRRMDLAQVEVTLCLYEDDTPSLWLPGAGDCFSGHDNFSERLALAFNQRPRDEPRELRAYFSTRALCDQVKPPRFGEVPNLELAATSVCDGLEREQRLLQQKYPDTPGL